MVAQRKISRRQVSSSDHVGAPCRSSRLKVALAFRLVAFTGLRRGELCGLRWCDLDLKGRTATIRQQLVESGQDLFFGEPKTKKGARVIALDSETVSLLRSHRAAQAAERLSWGPAYSDLDLIFCREDGSTLRPSQVSQRFVAMSQAAELPRIVLHALRRTHATHALAAGVPIKVVSDRLGHATSAFTADTYTRVLPEVDQQAADLVAKLVKNADLNRGVSNGP